MVIGMDLLKYVIAADSSEVGRTFQIRTENIWSQNCSFWKHTRTFVFAFCCDCLDYCNYADHGPTWPEDIRSFAYRLTLVNNYLLDVFCAMLCRRWMYKNFFIRFLKKRSIRIAIKPLSYINDRFGKMQFCTCNRQSIRLDLSRSLTSYFMKIVAISMSNERVQWSVGIVIGRCYIYGINDVTNHICKNS